MDKKRFALARRQRAPRRWIRWTLWALAGLAALFVVGNAVVWLAYRDRVLPNVRAAQVPQTITLQYQDKTATFNTVKAGMRTSEAATKQRLQTERSWLPLLDIVRGATVPAVLDVRQQLFVEELRRIQPTFEKPALGRRVVFSGSQFTIAEPVPGYRLDEQRFTETIKAYAAAGRTKLTVPISELTSETNGAGLEGELPALNEQLKTKITFTVQGQPKQPSVVDIGAWYVPSPLPSGDTMALSEEKVKAYVLGLAPSATNAGDAAAAVRYAVDKKVSPSFVVATNAAVKYTYCASAKGVAESHMPNFMAKVAATLGDPRGWNASGKVSFDRVESGCDFTIWLSAPSSMTSFGGLCDSYYSCRSGRNVVINFDRWQGATDPWNASGGSLEDYRVMVTNHEVGHWLGFGHANCSGPGQPAPVMQQQSISLQGCTFNPWPVPGELNTLKQNRGIASMQPREEYVSQGTCTCGRHA